MPSEQTPQGRFHIALSGGQPDRVPVFDFLFCQDLYQHVLGRRPQSYNPEDAVALSLALGLDAVYVPSGPPDGWRRRWVDIDRYVTEWGSTRRVSGTSWPVDPPVDYPIKCRADWENYALPDPGASGRLTPVRTALRLAEGRLAVLGSVGGPLGLACYLTGLENLSYFLYDDPALVRTILAACTEFSLSVARQMVVLGADAILVGDDYGWKQGPFLSPGQFREVVLPFLANLVGSVRECGVPVLLHSDGNLNQILDDIVATGISGLNPLQRTAQMDLGQVKARYGQQLCLSGNVDSSVTLPYGSVDDVVHETRECLAVGGPGGGYVLSSDHSLHDGIPIANMLAMIETGKRYGKYPLREPKRNR